MNIPRDVAKKLRKERQIQKLVQGEAPTPTALAHYVTDKVKNMCRKICLGVCASVSDCGKGSVSVTAPRNLTAIYKCAQRSMGRSVGRRGCLNE